MPLVDGVGAEHRKHEVANKLLAQIIDIDLVGTGCQRFFTDRIKLVSLSEVSRKCDDLAAVLVFQPLENNGGIQPTRIGENYLADFLFFCHEKSPLLSDII